MFEKIKQKFTLNDHQYTALMTRLQKLEVPAKTVLLNEGEIAKKIFLIEKGCIRVWFNNDGKEVTLQFFFENETVASMESFKTGMPSLANIETIEPCTLWYITKVDLDYLLPYFEQIPALRNEMINNVFDRMFYYMKHAVSFIRDTPKQRYENLMKERPSITQRVPQHYIASYLGISSVHLSRIKSKLAKEK